MVVGGSVEGGLKNYPFLSVSIWRLQDGSRSGGKQHGWVMAWAGLPSAGAGGLHL